MPAARLTARGRAAVLAAALVALAGGAGLLPGLAVADGPPPMPADARTTPLGAPLPPPDGSGGHAFLIDDDGPVRFDPCRPVHWVLRPDGAPADGPRLVRRAFAELSLRTGLQFVEDGTTDEAPRADRPSVQRDRYGDRWAPVLVAWSSGSVDPGLAGRVAAYAGPTAAEDGGPHLVTGQVVLDRDDLVQSDGRLAVFAWYALLHELGHLVGLAHVEDPGQLMHPQGRIAAYGAGDLRGLAAAGSGPCSRRG